MPRHPNPRRAQRGLSLVEAMVAMAVMGFGTLAVLGVQASLRLNGDIAKQRSEALRIAQEILEDGRAYADLDAFGALASDDGTAIEGYTTNASYTATVTVFDPAEAVEEADVARTLAPRRTTSVRVTWTDRTGTEQSVELHTGVTGVAPVLAGSLAVPAGLDPGSNPGGRNPAIPRDATPESGGTSRFNPPGAADGVAWIFNNVTGYITQICTGAESCTATNARLLAGYVRFALGTSQATAQEAEVPPSPRPATVLPQMRVLQTYPTAATVLCYEQQSTGYMAYFCAVPLGVDVMWSGRPELYDITLAPLIATPDAAKYKLCRYTAFRDQRAAPATISNEQHPRIYAQARNSLINQNYLVITGGNGTAAFGCPDDDTSTPFVSGRTWHHQPFE